MKKDKINITFFILTILNLNTAFAENNGPLLDIKPALLELSKPLLNIIPPPQQKKPTINPVIAQKIRPRLQSPENSTIKKITLFNASKKYNMQIEYFYCDMSAPKCFGPLETYLPPAKMGRNYQVFNNSDFLIVLKVTEKDASGVIRTIAKYEENFIDGCSTYTNYAKGINALILDDMRGTDLITCTQSVVSAKP